GGRRHPRDMSNVVRGRRIMRVGGEILITFGLVVLLFAAYEVYGKASAIESHQNVLADRLDKVWTQPVPGAATRSDASIEPGTPIARLYIPVMKLHWVVVEGVDVGDIRYAPGHYPGTAMPGQIGNFSVAGHRVPSLFWNLQDVRPGDQVVIQTQDNWYVYRVTVTEVVTPHSIEVVAPTPDRIGVAPTVATLTLTTCNPKWNDYQRMVVHAELVATMPYEDGPPVALGS
ncbi:MAG TPA: class E sortase, partial [Micromonosporaceae bacterium]|nr:class E sortase [Micromonosporaceae bacterium]